MRYRVSNRCVLFRVCTILLSPSYPPWYAMYQGDWHETYRPWYIFYHRLRVPLDRFARDIFVLLFLSRFAAGTWHMSPSAIRGVGTTSANSRIQTPLQREGATMRSLAANRALPRRPVVWIADTHRSDYDHLLADAKAEQLEIRFPASGRELLHCWFAGAPDVCIVNLQLQEFSGFDVVEMIQPFPAGTTVCLLTDKYEPEDEIPR